MINAGTFIKHYLPCRGVFCFVVIKLSEYLRLHTYNTFISFYFVYIFEIFGACEFVSSLYICIFSSIVSLSTIHIIFIYKDRFNIKIKPFNYSLKDDFNNELVRTRLQGKYI